MGNRAKRERGFICVDTLGWRREGVDRKVEERREEEERV